MTGRVPLARRNLLRQRLRLALSVGGVGLALLLILASDGIYGAILRQVTAYPDNAGAPVIVSQRGVDTMHMSSSALPVEIVDRLRADSHVARAEPILYASLILGDKQQAYSYLIGFRTAGGPWNLKSGSGRPHGNQIVLDQRTAEKIGVGQGSRVGVAGQKLRVVGLASGTASVVSAVAFVDYAAFARILNTHNTVSYVLVWPARGASAASLVARLNRDYPKLTAQTKEQFSGHERQVVSDMSTGLIRGLVLIGLIVGLIVAGLSIYTATTARLSQYAVLKAIGMRNSRLYGLISREALMMMGVGLVFALLLVVALSYVLPHVSPSVSLIVTGGAVLKTAVVAGAIGVLSALLPAWRVARADPASVYRS